MSAFARAFATLACRARIAAMVAAFFAVIGAAIVATPAAAQSTRSFANTTTAAIDGNTTCTNPIVRNFAVTSNFIVGDVDLGFLATHTWRGDIRITLQSPAGTRQQLVNGDEVSTSGDNLNVRLDDSGTQVVNTDDPVANHSGSGAPPYQHTFIPNAPLSVFNGQTSSGTWRLEICDIWPSEDNGTFLRSDLYLKPATNASGTGATFVVSSTADSGATTLRQAVIDANATTIEADTIAFAISGTGPHTITLSSALPNITDNGLLIDGTTQSGSQCRDLWTGTGHTLRIQVRGSGSFDGFRLGGANQVIRGLSITGFAQAIQLLAGSNSASVHCNYLGLLADGSSSGNTRGVWISGASARVGGLSAGQGNVISANSVVGVLTEQGSTDTAIRGNFIGTDPTGMSARANGTAINHWFGAGTWRDITYNLIAGNSSAAIVLETDDVITPATDLVRIQRNRIGVNRTLSALLRNGGDGILFPAGSISGVLIGGVASSDGNEITGNDDAIDLRGISNVTIQGNTIGVAVSRGIVLDNVSNVAIGGTSAGTGNTIGGNGGDGINVRNNSSAITIHGNLIQPITTAYGTFDNAGHGIALENVSNVTIGNGTAGGRNVIGGNRRRGIQGTGTNSAITINGNFIGTDATGNVAVTNGQNEGSTRKDAISFDAGTVSNLSIRNNVIGGYGAALVEVWNINSTGVTIQGNAIGVGANGTSQIVSGNIEDLIYIGGSPRGHADLLIGGSGTGQGNTLAFSSRSGIRIDSTGSNIQVIGNTIRDNTRNGIYLVNTSRAAMVSNRIYANGMTGIDLGENGVTTNDAGDGDSGPNDLLNFPQITAVRVAGAAQLQYNVTLDAPAAASGYRIEFFANSAADPSGFGEGERYLGHVDISHAGGSQTYMGQLTTQVPIAVGDIISATATRRTAGGTWDTTSEFSAVATALGMAELEVAISSQLFDPAPANPFATPGNDVLLTASVSNVGTGSTDADSIFAVLTMDQANAFLNAVTPSFGGIVGFASGSPALTFNPATDLRFSNSATRPSGFAQCSYTPVAGYDPQVRHVCLNPKGSLPNGTTTGQFTVQLRARIN